MSIAKINSIGGGPRTTGLVALTFVAAALGSSVTTFPSGMPEVHSADTCVGWELSQGQWTQDTTKCVGNLGEAPDAGCGSVDDGELNGDEQQAFWSFDSSLKKQCGLRRESTSLNSFAGKHVVVVGDSVARSVYASVLRIAAVDENAYQLTSQEKHRDWKHKLKDNGVSDFIWAPFMDNVTQTMDSLFMNNNSEKPPDVLILGAALWDALHVRDVEKYEQQVSKLSAKINSMHSSGNTKYSNGSKRINTDMFWLTVTMVDSTKLTDTQKIKHMTNEKLRRYDNVGKRFLVGKNKLVHPVDAREISSGCARVSGLNDTCSADGIHYRAVVYDATVQVIGNTVRVLGEV